MSRFYELETSSLIVGSYLLSLKFENEYMTGSEDSPR